MSEEPKVNYGYDPFAPEGRNRWGRKIDPNVVTPEIPGYEIIDMLGSGGMGTVWSAKYISLNQPRAIKILNPALALDAALLERFAEEAKALARLDHPNIVTVYDVSSDPDCPYMSMDFVGGKTLSDILKTRSLTPAETLKYLGQVAEALDYAHDMGFVHRDIKPSNVIIANSGNAMLIDFGVAIWLGRDGGRGNAIAGTTRYLSPEACRGERVTKASDLWAFAVLMYRTITGALPFDGKNHDEIVNAILHKPPKDPPHPKRRVREYLKSLFQKDPKLRPRSAVEMVEGLRNVLKPAVTRAGLEGIALGTSLLLLGIAGVLIAGAFAGYMVMRPSFGHGTGKTARGARAKSTSPESSAGSSAATSTAVVSASGSRADIGGVWYATMGSEWAEIRLSPPDGGKFRANCEERDSAGLGSVSSPGELDPHNGITFQEAESPTNPALANFVGRVDDDGRRITGKLKHADGSETDEVLVRAVDVPTTPYQDPTLNFSVPMPVGWLASSGEATTLAPIGRQDVAFIVGAAALDGATSVGDVFSRREQEYSAGGGQWSAYQNLGSGTRTVAGRPGTEWEFRVTSGGVVRHALIVGFIDGDRCVSVESWWPEAGADIWTPLLSMMSDKLAFAGG